MNVLRLLRRDTNEESFTVEPLMDTGHMLFEQVNYTNVKLNKKIKIGEAKCSPILSMTFHPGSANDLNIFFICLFTFVVRLNIQHSTH